MRDLQKFKKNDIIKEKRMEKEEMALTSNMKILTPDGYRTIGSLKKGDFFINGLGRRRKITEIKRKKENTVLMEFAEDVPEKAFKKCFDKKYEMEDPNRICTTWFSKVQCSKSHNFFVTGMSYKKHDYGFLCDLQMAYQIQDTHPERVQELRDTIPKSIGIYAKWLDGGHRFITYKRKNQFHLSGRVSSGRKEVIYLTADDRGENTCVLENGLVCSIF